MRNSRNFLSTILFTTVTLTNFAKFPPQFTTNSTREAHEAIEKNHFWKLYWNIIWTCWLKWRWDNLICKQQYLVRYALFFWRSSVCVVKSTRPHEIFLGMLESTCKTYIKHAKITRLCKILILKSDFGDYK